MELNHKQIKFIKKNIKRLTLPEIYSSLNISQTEISSFLISKWGKQKYDTFFSKQITQDLTQKTFFPTKNWLKSNLKYIVLLAVLAIGVYLNSLGNDFVSDDFGAIRNFPNIGNLGYIAYFRDLRSVIIFITYQIFGFTPAFFRLSNIFFHCGSTILSFIILSFFFEFPIPLIAAGIFAVHPIFIEAVAWISGGPYSNGAFFLLLSFLFYLFWQEKKSRKFYFLSLGLFPITVFFNIRAIVFPLMIAIYDVVNLKMNLKKVIYEILPYLIILGLISFYLLSAYNRRVPVLSSPTYQNPGIYNMVNIIPVAISSYIWLIFWPVNLSFYHSELTFNPFQMLTIYLTFFSFIALSIYCLIKNKNLFFWLSFFFVSLLLTLTPLTIAWVVAERYIYPGALGIFVLIAYLIEKIGTVIKFKKAAYIIFIVVIIGFSTRTILRNLDWRNQDFLWLATEKTAPSSPQNHNNLGDLYYRRNDYNRAIEEFKIAIKLLPTYSDAYHNLANVYLQTKQYDLAIENYQKAISFKPNLWQSRLNLAGIYFELQKLDLATEEANKVISINPKESRSYILLGLIYLKQNKSQSAASEFKKALEIDPGNQQIIQLLNSTNLNK